MEDEKSEFPKPLRFLALDFETTGLKFMEDNITQVGLVFCPGQVVESGEFVPDDPCEANWLSFSTFVFGLKEIPLEVQLKTSIKPEDVRQAPPMAEVLQMITAWLSASTGDTDLVLVTHNGTKFDLRFLARALFTCGYNVQRWLNQHNIVGHADILRIIPAQTSFPSNALGQMHLRVCGEDFADAHTALADCLATLRTLLKFKRDMSHSIQALPTMLNDLVRDCQLQLSDVCDMESEAADLDNHLMFELAPGKHLKCLVSLRPPFPLCLP